MRFICRIMVTGPNNTSVNAQLVLRSIIGRWVQQYSPSLQWWPYKLWRDHL